MSRDSLVQRLGWISILALVALAYMNALNAPFVYDDKIEVVGNPTIRDLSQLQAVFEYNVSRIWLILTYALNYRSFGLDPFGYHVTSIVIHGLAVAAGLTVLIRVGRLGGHPRPIWAGLITACLWAVHPMATEGVTYITGRSESLCALFVLLTLALWARALLIEGETKQVAVGPRAASVVLCFFAMGTKEVAAMTPFALLAMEHLFGRRREDSGLAWRWYLPFVGAIAMAVVARVLYAEHFIPREVDRPLLTQLSTQAEVWLRYAGLWLFPVGQTLYHHVADVDLLSVRGLTAWGGLGLVFLGVWRWSRTRPLVAFAFICAALFLMPSSSFVALKESMAEHRAYATGLYLIAAAVWSVPVRHSGRFLILASLLVPSYMAATIARNVVWSSEVSLWKEATQLSPEVAEGWYGLGDAHRFSGDYERAVEAYEKALSLDPTHLDSWNNLGIAKVSTGDAYGARSAWRSALKVQRSYCKAHANLGFLAHTRGQVEEAVVEFSTTLTYCPENTIAHYGLGTIYADNRRNPQRAIAHFEALLKIDPDFSRAEEVQQRLLELTW